MNAIDPNFVPVEGTDEECRILFALLQQRQHSISHSELPSYEEHKVFVQSKPYRNWYIIYLDGVPVGSSYVTDMNTVAVHLSAQHGWLLPTVYRCLVTSHVPLPEVKSIRTSTFITNVGPDNSLAQEQLQQMGGKLVQLTYDLGHIAANIESKGH